MFASIKINPSFVAKLGCAVTIIVSISACSSESIQSDGALIPPALNMPTPEPDSNSDLNQYAALDQPPALARAKRHKKKSRIAHHKAKKKATQGTSAARVSKAEINGPSNPSAPAFSNALPVPNVDQNIGEVFSAAPTEQNKNFWLYWLAGVIFATGGLMWFALRRGGFGRDKRRRLIFN